MSNYKARGIVIKRDNIGEADRLVTLFSDRFGKINIIAKGARRPKSRFASATDLFCEIEFVAARGKSLDILTEVKIVSSHAGITDSLNKTKNACFVGELINGMIHDQEPHPNLYKLLSSTLNAIKKNHSNLAVDYFIYNCLTMLGYEPELDRCATTGKKLSIDDNLIFSPSSGGVVCKIDNTVAGRPIDTDTIKALRYLRQPWEQVVRLKIPSNISSRVHMHLKDFAEATLEREIKSERMMNKE